MKKILTTVFVLAIFSGCGDDTNDITQKVESEITEKQKIAKNPQFLIYSSKCVQDSNNTLCGYKEPITDEHVPTIPAALPPSCSDKVYCL